MKRGILSLLAAAALAVALFAMIFLYQPSRPRPEGWQQPWAALPLEHEGDWAIQPLKRGVVQACFFSATDTLTRCLQQYGAPEGAVVKLELLLETEHGGTHPEYVVAAPRSDLPGGLVSCLTGALEAVTPVRTPQLPEGTLWRLEVPFLVPPLADLPVAPWWRRWVPAQWRPPGSRGNQVG